jgi:hypothetical protein
MGVLIFWGLTGVGAFSQEKVKPEKAGHSPPAAVVPSEDFRMGGIIIAIDPAGDKILIQQPKGKGERTVTLNLDKEGTGKISAFRKGDAVNVWVKGSTVTKIEKVPPPVWEEIRKEGK